MTPSLDAPPKSRLRVTLGVMLLVVYSGIVLSVTLSPAQLDLDYQNALLGFIEALHRNGVPGWFGYREIEFFANIAMFLPFGFLVAILLPERLSVLTVFLGPAFSALIETIQREFLSQRVASLYDVFANSVGAIAGLGLAVGLRAIVHRRDRKLVARAIWQYQHGFNPTGR